MKLTDVNFPDLDAALDAQSWQWLKDNEPLFADAIALEIKRGHKPEEIRQRAMRMTQREGIALRLEQAARHLAKEAT